jgi:fructose-1,6-bisphosphatase/inositol monophosphatase family enzyme
MSCPTEFLALAERLAEASGKIVRRYFRTGVEIITKADASPVTIADRETETALRQMVKLAYPDHGLLGEEFPAERADAEFVWIFDPIDGTKSFITGRPLFGTLIALAPYVRHTRGHRRLQPRAAQGGPDPLRR